MPRRNLVIILAVAVVSLVCYRTSARDPYTRYFEQNWGHITTHFLEADKLDRRELFEAAMQGIIDKLDDEHSAYLGPQRSNRLDEDLHGEFGGIGVVVEFDQKANQLIVLSPIAGTPAYEMGLLSGDRIVAVDDKTTQGMAMEDVIARIKGRPGTKVKLSVMREGQADPITLEVARAVIKVDSVLGDTRAADNTWNYFPAGHPEIGYVRISSFGERTVEEFKAALVKMRAADLKGLIIDLRNNPGGLLLGAVEICDLFVDRSKFDGQIVSVQGHSPRELETYAASGNPPYHDVPVVVLINKYTASAAEIVAACLQDHERAIVIGERSFGKGTVQNVIRVEGGQSMLKLTTASYWRPSGKNIHRFKDASESADWGVMPNAGYEAPTTDEELKTWFRQRRQRDQMRPLGRTPAEKPTGAEPSQISDRALEKAIEVLAGATPAMEPAAKSTVP